MRLPRHVAVVLLLTLGTAVADPVVGAATTAPYSFVQQAISDLAISTCGPFVGSGSTRDVCSPLWPVMSVAMMVTGVALAGTGVLARRRLGAGRAALVLLAVAGACSVGVGLVPLDRSIAWHTALAVPIFPALALATALLARPLGTIAGRGWRSAFLAGAAVQAVALLAIVAPGPVDVPFGVAERVAAYLLPLLLGAFVVRLLVAPGSDDGLTVQADGRSF